MATASQNRRWQPVEPPLPCLDIETAVPARTSRAISPFLQCFEACGRASAYPSLASLRMTMPDRLLVERLRDTMYGASPLTQFGLVAGAIGTALEQPESDHGGRLPRRSRKYSRGVKRSLFHLFLDVQPCSPLAFSAGCWIGGGAQLSDDGHMHQTGKFVQEVGREPSLSERCWWMKFELPLTKSVPHRRRG